MSSDIYFRFHAGARAILLCALFLVACAHPLYADGGDQGSGQTPGIVPEARTGLSIVESGTDQGSNRLYTIRADNVEITDLLKALFKKTNGELAIDQDVSGPVNLSIRNLPFRDTLQWIVQVVRPPIKIVRKDNIYHVSRDMEAKRDFDAKQAAAAIAERMGQGRAGMGNNGLPLPYTPGMNGTSRLGQNSPLLTGVPMDRMVTLDVPETKPIPLADALARISTQTRFPIHVDPRVSREVSFAGVITQAPLSLVLQKIADSSGLKVVANGMQATFYPTDQFTLRVNGLLLGQSPTDTCAKCGQSLAVGWSFCPFCGQASAHVAPTPQTTGKGNPKGP
jgi:hypothetical protein